MAEFTWWQPAISAGFGAAAGFLGGRAAKWLDDRAARSARRVEQAWTAMRDHSLAVLRRLEELEQLPDGELEALFAQKGPLPADLHVQFDQAADTVNDVLKRLKGTAPRDAAYGATSVRMLLAAARTAWMVSDQPARDPTRYEDEPEHLERLRRRWAQEAATQRVRESLRLLDREIRTELKLLQQVKP